MTNDTPIPERLAACEPLYRAMLKTLHAVAHSDDGLRSDVAVVTLTDMAADVAVSSGLLWETGDGVDIVKALRDLSDILQHRRDREPAKPLLGTVREVFADRARPAMAN